MPDVDDTLRNPLGRVNRFVLLERIGSGGMGELFAAYDAQLDRKIAIKLVRSGRGGREAEIRLLREAQVLAKISHPNVVAVYEAGVEDERVFVAMEYIRGLTLTAWLERARALPEPQRVAELLVHFRDAGRGLAAVHEAGLAHRDFKPDNVLVGADGRVRVVDFGTARSMVEPEPARSSESGRRVQEESTPSELDTDRLDLMVTPEVETVAGTVLGTPRYMAPEQWRAQRGDSRSDQFSFCVALHRALFGVWPYGGDGLTGLRAAVIGGDLNDPPRKSEVSARLSAALQRGLATDPADRFADMSELIAAIDEALAPKRRRIGRFGTALGVVLAAGFWLLGPNPTPVGLDVVELTTTLEREILAERRRQQIDAQVEALADASEHGEADAVFDAFASQAEYANTRALALAWLDQARRLRERGEQARELMALGEAQLASPSADLRQLALFELARVFFANHRYDQLGPTLSLLDALDRELALAPELQTEVARMRIHEAASRRDFAGALEVMGEAGELRPLLDQLGRARITGHVVVAGGDLRGTALVELPSLDLDGDQQGDLVLTTAEGSVHVLGSSPDLPILHDLELPLPPGPRAPLTFKPISSALNRSGAPNWLLTDVYSKRCLIELVEDSGKVVARRLPVDLHGVGWATADLVDGPDWPGWEAWGGDVERRRLVGLRPAGASFELFAPTPRFESLRSVVQDVAVVDLDGDGRDELVVGVGAWWAYDVRVLSSIGEQDPGAFELAARRKLGAIEGLIGFRAPNRRNSIAVSLPSTPPSPRVFPSSARAGQPAGVYVLGWAGEGQSLDIVDHVALPNNFRPGAGDIDGDERNELVVQTQTGIALLWADANDRYSPILLDGLWYHAIVDLDGDGDDELVVSALAGEAANRLVVLGLGDERMPLFQSAAAPLEQPPAELDEALADSWRQAEGLANIGLGERAIAAFVALARLASPDQAMFAYRRAAEIDERSGTGRQAGELYERAGDRDSLERAVARYEHSHRHADAARVARGLADSDSPGDWRSRADALDELARPHHRLDFDFRNPLDARWRIARPGLVRHEAKGLRVESLGASEPMLARRAIVWTGGRLELEFDLELETLEWGSGFHIALVPVDEHGQVEGELIGLQGAAAWGGGDHYLLDLSGVGGDSGPAMRGVTPPSGYHHLRLRMDLLAGTERRWSTVMTLSENGPAETKLELDQPVLGGPLRPGRYELQMRSHDVPWMRGSVRLERLQILGAHDDPAARPATEREQIMLAQANGEHDQALALLDSLPGLDGRDELVARDTSWLRALTLEQLGRWPEALEFLEPALADCAPTPELLARFGHILLLEPDRAGPTLRRICPRDNFLLNTWAVTQTALYQHKDHADLHRTLTTQVIDLDRYEPADLVEARALLGLLSARARGWLMQDAVSAGESDLRRALEVSAQWLAADSISDQDRDEIRHIAAFAHIELAVARMARDHHDAAASELERALAVDPDPEIIADVIRARTVFERLESAALWSTVTRAQLGLGREAIAATKG